MHQLSLQFPPEDPKQQQEPPDADENGDDSATRSTVTLLPAELVGMMPAEEVCERGKRRTEIKVAVEKALDARLIGVTPAPAPEPAERRRSRRDSQFESS